MLECTARLEEDIFCRSPHHPLLIFGAQEGQAIENEIERLRISVGRLHLKWGEALGYAGKKDEAKGQFARAAQLDLTGAGKVELARQSPHA